MVPFVGCRRILAKQITIAAVAQGRQGAERFATVQPRNERWCNKSHGRPFPSCQSHSAALASAGGFFGYAMPSTSIRKFEYDPDSRILSVWFVASGRHYQFLDVPLENFVGFKSAFAKGRYFNDHIRNRFAFRLVT